MNCKTDDYSLANTMRVLQEIGRREKIPHADKTEAAFGEASQLTLGAIDEALTAEVARLRQEFEELKHGPRTLGALFAIAKLGHELSAYQGAQQSLIAIVGALGGLDLEVDGLQDCHRWLLRDLTLAGLKYEAE